MQPTEATSAGRARRGGRDAVARQVRGRLVLAVGATAPSCASVATRFPHPRLTHGTASLVFALNGRRVRAWRDGGKSSLTTWQG
jgi:hypothetical protein